MVVIHMMAHRDSDRVVVIHMKDRRDSDRVVVVLVNT